MTSTAPTALDSTDVSPADSDQVWDLLVIGGGTAGIVAARSAAAVDASVLLVERAETGRDCLRTGCVPSKALLACAAVAADGRRATRFGVQVDGLRVDVGVVMTHVQAAIAAIEPQDSAQNLIAAGVRVVHGAARFTGLLATAEVDGRRIRFRQALIAGRLVIQGGGSVGCGLGQAFARLGSQVTILHAAPRLLMSEDPDAANTIAAALTQDGASGSRGCTRGCSAERRRASPRSRRHAGPAPARAYEPPRAAHPTDDASRPRTPGPPAGSRPPPPGPKTRAEPSPSASSPTQNRTRPTAAIGRAHRLPAWQLQRDGVAWFVPGQPALGQQRVGVCSRLPARETLPSGLLTAAVESFVHLRNPGRLTNPCRRQPRSQPNVATPMVSSATDTRRRGP